MIGRSINDVQYSGWFAILRMHTISTDRDVQYRSDIPSVQRSHIISADMVCSTGEAHYHHEHGCAAQISHTISTDEGVQYRTTRTAQGVDDGCIYLDSFSMLI